MYVYIYIYIYSSTTLQECSITFPAYKGPMVRAGTILVAELKRLTEAAAATRSAARPLALGVEARPLALMPPAEP